MTLSISCASSSHSVFCLLNKWTAKSSKARSSCEWKLNCLHQSPGYFYQAEMTSFTPLWGEGSTKCGDHESHRKEHEISALYVTSLFHCLAVTNNFPPQRFAVNFRYPCDYLSRFFYSSLSLLFFTAQNYISLYNFFIVHFSHRQRNSFSGFSAFPTFHLDGRSDTAIPASRTIVIYILYSELQSKQLWRNKIMQTMSARHAAQYRMKTKLCLPIRWQWMW